jgi:hypothetical protein
MDVVKVTAVRRRLAGKNSAQPNNSEANIAFVAQTAKSGAPTLCARAARRRSSVWS